MQRCDLYYNSPLPSGEDKLYLAVMDLVQVGDTSTDAEPDVARDQNEAAIQRTSGKKTL